MGDALFISFDKFREVLRFHTVVMVNSTANITKLFDNMFVLSDYPGHFTLKCHILLSIGIWKELKPKRLLIRYNAEYYMHSIYVSLTSSSLTLYNTQYSCCGVTGYLDFGAAENWSRTSVIHPKNNRVVVYLKIPFSCCKPDATDYKCASVGNTKNDYYETVSVV